MIFPLLSLIVLGICAYAWFPRNTVGKQNARTVEPELPDLVELPPPDAIPDDITIFGSKSATHNPIAITREKKNDAAYRLCAYAGGDGLWVVSVQDGGCYYTVRSGERIPGTSLEFRNMQFRTSETGLQIGDAVFYDNTNSNFVDVMACAEGSGSLSTNAKAQ
jgi:hypothetical protein